jgi:hypothetical protein
MTAYDLSVGVFVRGLNNLKSQLAEAEAHGAPLDAQLALPGTAGNARFDLHGYPLAAHVHWAAEGARLAIAHLLGESPAPAQAEAQSFADLQQHLDETITYLQGLAPADLEAGLARTITIEKRGGATSASGDRFLAAFAIPHFYYHLTTAYGILRNEGVPLTMGDFLGNWGAH